VPAAAVIPAPIAYANAVAVKTLVVGFSHRVVRVSGPLGVCLLLYSDLLVTQTEPHPCGNRSACCPGGNANAQTTC